MKEQEKIQLLEKIDQYIKGELSQEEIDELWKKFLQNPEWYNWFETELHLRSLINKGLKPGLNTVEEPNSSAKSTVKGYITWVYAAAAAVLLAIGLQFFTFEQGAPIPSFALTEIEQSNLIGADVLRSDDEPSENLDVSINDALANAYEGDTAQAIEKFQELLNQSPDNQQQARIEMNLGILFYNSGDYDSAKTHFQSITEIENIEDYQTEKAWWFFGNALLHLDQPREARQAVFNAYNMNGRYQSEAHSLLQKLDVRLGYTSSEDSPKRLGE